MLAAGNNKLAARGFFFLFFLSHFGRKPGFLYKGIGMLSRVGKMHFALRGKGSGVLPGTVSGSLIDKHTTVIRSQQRGEQIKQQDNRC